MSITASAVLVEMNINIWAANKLDHSTTDKVLYDNNATADSGRFHKNLMAGTRARKDIADYVTSFRTWHLKNTLPWADRGCRLLPTSMFMEYKQASDCRRDTFNNMVDAFVVDYPALVQVANNYLGTLFDAGDYPTADEVRDKFGFRRVISPVPESGDFRLDIATTELDEVRAEYEQAFDTRLGDAMKEPWDRLHKVLTSISSRLEGTTEDNETSKRYYSSLVTNATDLCGMLTHLNITKDPKLEEARRQLELTMSGVSIEGVKRDFSTRKDLKSDVDNILKQFDW